MTMTDTGGPGVAVTSADGRGVAPLITAIEDPIAPESKCPKKCGAASAAQHRHTVLTISWSFE